MEPNARLRAQGPGLASYGRDKQYATRLIKGVGFRLDLRLRV